MSRYFVADAHRGHGKRFVVHADEKLTAFIEFESAIRGLTRVVRRNPAVWADIELQTANSS
jgi:hypothetical protein